VGPGPTRWQRASPFRSLLPTGLPAEVRSADYNAFRCDPSTGRMNQSRLARLINCPEWATLVHFPKLVGQRGGQPALRLSSAAKACIKSPRRCCRSSPESPRTKSPTRNQDERTGHGARPGTGYNGSGRGERRDPRRPHACPLDVIFCKHPPPPDWPPRP